MKKSFKKISAMLLTAAFAVGASACEVNNKETKKTDDKLNIYASFYPMYEFTQAIVGDVAEVVNIMPPGSASHGWEPSAKQVAELKNADFLVYQGAGMEEWIDDVKATLKAEDSKLMFVEASEGVELLAGQAHDHGEHADEHDHEELEDEHDHGEHADEHKHEEHADEHVLHESHDHAHNYAFDPHVWLSPKNSDKMAQNIMTALSKLDPENAKTFEKNYETLSKKFTDLDELYRTKLTENKVKSFVITHEAFGYIAHEYGLVQYGLTGMGTEEEPNPERLAEVVKLVKDEEMKAIFYDDGGSDKIAQVVAAEAGLTNVLPLTTMHSPTEDELAEKNDYFTLMERNLNNLLKNSK